MNSLPFKNTLRALFGHFAMTIGGSPAGQPQLYVNLRGSSATGGPHRFLRNFLGELEQYDVRVTNWAVKGSHAALVFSVSWGDSFTRLCRRHAVRSVLRVDGFFVPDESEYPLTETQHYVNGRLQRDLEQFDHVIYQSAYSKEKADQHLYRRDGDFSIIHNGVDTHFFRPQEKELADQPVIVVLGKHYPSHLRLAAQVFRRVHAERSAKLVIIGPMRDGSNRVRETIGEYLAGEPALASVECVGTVGYDRLPEFLAPADLFLHVKVGDWCPNAVTEALSCGLPVVCPAVGGTREIVGPGGLAAEGSGGDESLGAAMAEATVRILDDLPNFQAAARGVAVNDLDRKRVARRYAEVLGLSETRAA